MRELFFVSGFASEDGTLDVLYAKQCLRLEGSEGNCCGPLKYEICCENGFDKENIFQTMIKLIVICHDVSNKSA